MCVRAAEGAPQSRTGGRGVEGDHHHDGNVGGDPDTLRPRWQESARPKLLWRCLTRAPGALAEGEAGREHHCSRSADQLHLPALTLTLTLPLTLTLTLTLEP